MTPLSIITFFMFERRLRIYLAPPPHFVAQVLMLEKRPSNVRWFDNVSKYLLFERQKV